MTVLSRFWYVPLTKIIPDDTARQAVLAAELIDESMLGEGQREWFHKAGIRAGDLLALMEGTTLRRLGRVLAVDARAVRWHALPSDVGPSLTSAPALALVPEYEAGQFKVGIDTLLRDTRRPLVLPEGPPSKPHNIILYGPPGTGKTYSLKQRALSLLLGEGAGDTPEERAEQWEALQESGRVALCTFHQAYTYEDFVEGLRAETTGDHQVRYRVKAGLFKLMACRAILEGLPSSSPGPVQGPGESRDDAVVRRAMEAVRTGEALHFRGSTTTTGTEGMVTARGVVTRNDRNARILRLPKPIEDALGDRTSFRLRAAGGTFDQEVNRPPSQRSRVTNLGALFDAFGLGPADRTTSEGLTDSDLLEVEWRYQPRKDLVELLRAGEVGANRQYVLVIDEINRANIARVLGELITLIEPDKRLTAEDGLRLVLPASGDLFGVPPNLHIIGTMNTADRSIALMDVALRRRFTFEEMRPSAKVIEEVLGARKVHTALIELTVQLFNQLNYRLRFLYDREHQVGHAYFLMVQTLEDLRETMALKVLPLLQEYFFGQWEKVAMVLGYPVKQEGVPKSYRPDPDDVPTILTAEELLELKVLGFDHDEYVDQVAWELHPAFCATWESPAGLDRELWLAKAFYEVLVREGRDALATRFVGRLRGEGT